jgi:hypothetical protein
MAETVHSFNEYVEEGSKLAQFKEIYSTFEKMGKDVKNLKGFVDSVKNLEFIENIKDKFEANLSVSEKMNEALKNMGLTDSSLKLINEFTSAANPYIMSVYGAIETFGRSILEDVVSAVTSKIYIPEEVFLVAVKGMALAKSDPNSGGVLRNAALRHDLVETIKWLDNYNNASTYDLNSGRAQDAITAARNGSFHVALYILGQLKKTYAEIKASVAFNQADEQRIKLELARYERFYNSVIKTIIVYSYNNLTLTEVQKIIKDFPTFVPACLGTNYSENSKTATIVSYDIDIMAPIVYYRTAAEMWGNNSGEVFIDPLNKNIKKIYVYLAFSTDFNESERLVNEALHTRLKFKMLSTMEKAFYESQNSLLNSPLGQFVLGAREDYLSSIAGYVRKVDRYLFDPKSQESLITDQVTLPDFRPRMAADKDGNYKKTLKDSLPEPSSFSKNNLSYDDFEVYYVDPLFSKEKITKDSLAIAQKRSLPYMMSRYIQTISPEINTSLIVTKQYFIFYSNRFGSNIQETDREDILNYIMVKYIIDYYSESGFTLETIAAMFPELNEAGLFSLFNDYYHLLKDETDYTPSPSAGLDRPINIIPFYREVLNPSGEVVKIEDSGINTYNIFGEKINTYQAQGSPVGISIIGNDTYLLSLNPKNTQLEAYYSPDEGLSFMKMEGNANEAEVYPGVGITSIHQVNFFKSIYYMNILFIIRNNTIAYSFDRVEFTDLTIPFDTPNEKLLGLSILPDGTLYLLTNICIYMIENFNIDDDPNFILIKISSNDGEFSIIEDVVGTIINAVSIPLNTTDDFDIDDKAIISKLLMYYRSNKVLYYWYSPESPITVDIFDDNIARLQAKLDMTIDNVRKMQLQRCIERQEYFRSKIA